jgi:hypothetical protein
MQTTPNEVLHGQAPKLKESTVKSAIEGLPSDQEVEALRQQRIRFDGFFTGQTW